MRATVATGPQTFSSEVVSSASTWSDRWALGLIQRRIAPAPLGFRLWDGFEIRPADGSPIGTFVIKNRRALLGWVWDPDLYFGEAFMFGAIEIRGDLVETLEAAFRALATAKPRPWWLWQSSNDRRAARDDVHHH